MIVNFVFQTSPKPLKRQRQTKALDEGFPTHLFPWSYLFPFKSYGHSSCAPETTHCALKVLPVMQHDCADLNKHSREEKR
jgi:hypothetical protein